MPDYPRIAIVILNWNGIRFLQQFLPNVKKNSAGASIVIADNNSSDNSLSWLRENHPDVTLIEMKSNTGFAGGYNKALKQVDADIYVLLNSDVEVTSNWLKPLKRCEFNCVKSCVPLPVSTYWLFASASSLVKGV